jgi:hypothetical protein
VRTRNSADRFLSEVSFTAATKAHAALGSIVDMELELQAKDAELKSVIEE